ncbi:MAG: FAD-dependent oxidoreductase [Clostridia bacterium]|nr:FAD-dependent oxidoreductase [Clostridia bacterium]
MKEIDVSRRIQVTESADVVICGAGPAGWVAAIAAARQGLSVVLADRYGFPGGTAVSGYVLPISGFYYNGNRVAGDIAYEFAKRMEAAGAAIFEMPRGNVSFDPEYYRIIATRMLDEAGVTFASNVYIDGVVADDVPDGRRLSHVTVAGKSGHEAFEGKIFIDATGDGDVCAMANVPMQPDDPARQPMSLCFALAGVDTSTELLKNSIHHDGKHGPRSRNVTIREVLLADPEVGDFCGPWFNTAVSAGTIVVNITRTDCDATDRRAYAAAEKKLREDMLMLVGKLKANFREFSECSIVASAINAGIRESRRIRGRYTLTGDDFLSGQIPLCPVAACSHPVDIHAPSGAGQTVIWLDHPGYIPFGSLVADGFPNLIAAGRCISVDPTAFASIRVQGTCMTVGEAAGKAAAFCLEKGISVTEADTEGFDPGTVRSF